MPEDVNTQPYDPDEPPESSFVTDFIGVLVTSAIVQPDNLTTLPPHVVESATKYWEKSSGRTPPLWYLEAHALNFARSDGQPFRQTDIIALTDKNGRWLGKKMTPDTYASVYRGLGVSASYNKVGQADSAVGRAFHFKETELKLGKSFKKSFSLYPLELMPVGYKYEGEVETIDVSKADNSNGASPAAPAAVPQEQAISLLRESLAGKTPGEMFEAIMESPQLKGVGQLFGVGLIEAATDESLAKVLTENNVLVLNSEGKFEVPA